MDLIFHRRKARPSFLLKSQQGTDKKLVGLKIFQTKDALIPTAEFPCSADTPGNLEPEIEIIVVRAAHGLLIIGDIVIPCTEQINNDVLSETDTDIGAYFEQMLVVIREVGVISIILIRYSATD